MTTLPTSLTSNQSTQLSSQTVEEEVVNEPKTPAKGSVKSDGGWLEPVQLTRTAATSVSAASTDQQISVEELLGGERRLSPLLYPARPSDGEITTIPFGRQFSGNTPFLGIFTAAQAQKAPDIRVRPLVEEMRATLPNLKIEQLRQQIENTYSQREKLLQRMPQLNREKLQEALSKIETFDAKLAELELQLKQIVLRDLAIAASKIGPTTSSKEYDVYLYERPLVPEVSDYLSDTQLDIAAANLKRKSAYAGLETVIDQARAKLELEREVQQSFVSPALLNDRVSNGFVNASDVNFGAMDPVANPIHFELAIKDPVIAVLVQSAGIIIETTHAHTTKVTINGVELALTAEQKAFVEAKQYSAFAMTLLQAASQKGTLEFSPKVQTLLSILPEMRAAYTKAEVDWFLQRGQEENALRVLTASMNAALSPMERELVWQTAGYPHFNEAYFDRKITRALNTPVSQTGLDPRKAGMAADNVGRWVQRFVNGGNVPREAADIILNQIKENFDNSWYRSNNPDERPLDEAKRTQFFAWSRKENGVDFSRGLIDLVELSGDRAGEISDWLLTSPENAPIHPLGKKITHMLTPYMGGEGSYGYYGMSVAVGRPASNETVFEVRPRSPLSEAVLTHQLGQLSDRYKIDLQNDIDRNDRKYIQQRVQEYALESYNSLRSNPSAAVSPYFNRFLSGPDVTRPAQYKGVELRNYIGRAMGMVPTNGKAAEANDNRLAWYSDPEQDKAIRVVEAWIKQEGGNAPTLSAIPMIYADAKQGVINLTLFQVQTPDGPVIIDSSMANIALKGPGGESFQIGDKPDQPMRYDDFDSYIKENRLSEKGTLYIPKKNSGPAGDSFSFRNSDGGLQFQAVRAAVETRGEAIMYYVDWTVAIGGAVVGVAGAAFSGGQSLWLTYASVGMMTYGAVRTGVELNNMYQHGQSMSFSNPEARAQYLGAIGMVGGITAANLARMSKGFSESAKAFQIEARALQHAGIVADDVLFAGEQALLKASALKKYAYGVSGVDIAASGTVIVEQGIPLFQNWDQLSPKERAEGLSMLGLNMVPLGMGIGTFHKTFAPNESVVKSQAEGLARERQLGLQTPEISMLEPNIIVPDNKIITSEVKIIEPEKIIKPEPTIITAESLISGLNEVPVELIDPRYRLAGQHIEPSFDAGLMNIGKLQVELSPRVPEKEFWPNPDVNLPRPRFTAIFAGYAGQWILKMMPGSDSYNSGVYTRMLAKADPRIRAYLPTLSSISVDRNTMERALLPPGLNFIANDFHYHAWPYDRRAGVGLLATLANTPENIQILIGPIPQHCGQGAHYSTANPVELTLQNARHLDSRTANEFLKIYAQDPKLAARLRISLTGVGDPEAGFSSQYIRQRMLEYPGVFESIGEITANKEMVTRMLGKEGWTVLDAQYQEVIGFAQETGLSVLLHSDWGHAGHDHDGRVAATKSGYEYEYFDQLIEAHGAENLRKLNIVFAHTGIGRFIRPNDVLIKKNVDIINWDFKEGKEISRKTIELEAPEHVHKIYEMIAKVPNARFDVSWSDVSQAYMDSPSLRKALVDFIVNNPDRIMFGSDSVMPPNSAYYNAPLKIMEPLIADIALRSPMAAWKFVRGNFESIMDIGRDKSQEWTRQQLSNMEGGQQKIAEMTERTAILTEQRNRMTGQALGDFHKWLGDLQETWEQHSKYALGYNLQERFRQSLNNDEQGMIRLQTFNAHEASLTPEYGMNATAYSSLPDGKKLEILESRTRTGIGTPGGARNEPGNSVQEAAAINVGFLGGLSAWLGISFTGVAANKSHSTAEGAVLPKGAEIASDAAFTSRGISTIVKTAYAEKLRMDWDAIFVHGQVDRESLNRLVSRIYSAQKAMNFTDEQMLRVFALSEQLYKNYSYLRDVQYDWTPQQRFDQIMATLAEYQSWLDREIGMQASTLSHFDPRRGPGQIERATNLITLLVNDAAALAWITANGIDLSSPENIVRSLVPLLFGIGNGLLTGHSIVGLGGGLAKVDLETSRAMRWMQSMSTSIIGGGGAFWTVQDGMAAIEAIANGNMGQAAFHTLNTILDIVFTASTMKNAETQLKKLLSMPSISPQDQRMWIMVAGGALALRTTLEIGGDMLREDGETSDEDEGTVTPLPVEESREGRSPTYPLTPLEVPPTDGTPLNIEELEPDLQKPETEEAEKDDIGSV